MPEILQTGKEVILKLIEGISLLLEPLFNKIVEIATTIHDKIAELPARIYDIGSNIVRGLWNGISDMKSWVISKIQGFGDDVLQGLRDFFGIASPSRVMADSVGKYLAQGIGVGFADEMQSVSDQMRDSIPTNFNIGANVDEGGLATTGGLDYYTLVAAFKTALEDMSVELDDVQLGKFVDKTVANTIYQ